MFHCDIWSVISESFDSVIMHSFNSYYWKENNCSFSNYCTLTSPIAILMLLLYDNSCLIVYVCMGLWNLLCERFSCNSCDCYSVPLHNINIHNFCDWCCPRPPLWLSGQSSWLQIQRSKFDSLRYQIFWEVVGLEWGTLSLVSTIEELLGRNSNGSSLENREYGLGGLLQWPRNTFYPQKLALTSPTSGGRSVSIVCLQTRATEL
jgi:hypothetical protein